MMDTNYSPIRFTLKGDVMVVYVYCSYDGSPVGFQLGKITVEPSAASRYYMLKKPESPFIAKVFGNGIISRAWGWNTENSTYFVLYKGLNGFGKYINLAFEFAESEFDGFTQFKGNMDMLPDKELARRCAEFVLESENDAVYALKIDAGKIRTFIDEMRQPGGKAAANEGWTYFKSSRPSDVSDKIAKAVDLKVKYKNGIYMHSEENRFMQKEKLIWPVAAGVLCLSLFGNILLGRISLAIHNSNTDLENEKKNLENEKDNLNREIASLMAECISLRNEIDRLRGEIDNREINIAPQSESTGQKEE